MKFIIIILPLVLLTTSSAPERSEWTVETLKDYFDTRFDALDKAVTKQEDSNNEKFRNSNEFRSSLEDQQRTFMPRTEAEAINKTFTSRLEIMEAELNRIKAEKSGGSATIAYMIAIVSTVIAIIMAFRKWNPGEKLIR